MGEANSHGRVLECVRSQGDIKAPAIITTRSLIRHNFMRQNLIILTSVLLIGGCASPVTNSSDSEANYRHVFSTLSASKPTIVHSQVERLHRSIPGIFPLAAQRNGDWEFELLIYPNGWTR